MNKPLQFSAFALLVLFVLFYGFEYFNKQKDTKALLLINSLQKLQVLDGELDNSLQNISENVYVNYDRIQGITTEITALFKELHQQEWNNDYLNSVNGINKDFQKKIEIIELLKRENSILRNSIQFINHLSKEIFQLKIENSKIIGHIHQSLWNLNYIKQSGDMAFVEEVRQSIDHLSKAETSIPGLKKELDLIVLHERMIINKLPSYTEWMKESFEIPTSQDLDVLIEALVKTRNANNTRSRIYEAISIIFILILGVIVFFLNRRHVLSQAELLEAAQHDPQTGAFNRYALAQDIAKVSPPFVVLFLDIDKFHFINDAFGANAADELLVSFHNSLKSAFQRPVYRKGADEFILILEHTSTENAKKEILKSNASIVEASELNFTFTTLVYAYNEPMLVHNFENDLQAGRYSAKLGRERVSIYDPNDKNVTFYKNLSVNAHKERNRIVTALAEDRFFPHFQPIYDIALGKTTKYEALARLREGDQILSPYKFILIAEQFNLIGEITRKIFEKTLVKASKNKDISFSVNLSAHDMSDDKLLDFIEEKMREYDVEPEKITFEITETATMTDINETIVFIKKLRGMGFLFAIDDFGVGQSSLQYIKDLPSDYIKIDGSFIVDIAKSDETREFVSLIHKVISLHGKKSVAEFVEDEAILTVLQEIGIDYAQGYHIGKPAEELLSE